MPHFRSIFFYWWMLLIALYAVKQPLYLNVATSGTYAETSCLQATDYILASQEYLTTGFIFTSGYDVKTAIPDVDIPYWARIPEPLLKSAGSDLTLICITWVANSLIIIFPFHDFW